jgi:pimeloyl-ACP methyl ester carboxylesterase
MPDVLLDGRRLETARWGDGSPTLVLLHEGLGCVALWRDFPQRLAEATGCGVFAYSRFGYGRSDPATLPRPMDYMQDEARLVLPRVLDAAGVASCVLVGHSDGGSIAAVYAGAARDPRLRGLVLIAPHFFVEDMCLASIAQAKLAYDGGDLRTRLARYHADVDCAFRGWNDAWLDPRFRAFDLTGFLPEIGVPVLVLQGVDDPYGTVVQPQAVQRLVPAPVTVRMLDGARHAPHSEQPDASLNEIRRFTAALAEVNAL